MNAMTLLFPAFLLLLLAQSYVRSRWLFATWTFLYCLLPTYVYRIGSVSLYWCDIAAVAVLFYWYNDRVPRKSAYLALQWFAVLMGTLLIGGLSSLVRYGAFFEPLYWILRYALALATLPIVTAYSRQPPLRSAMLAGVSAAAVSMFVIAIFQEFRLPFNDQLDSILYDGYASGRSDHGRSAVFATEGLVRVFGPYSSSTQFGGAAVCVGVLLTMLSWTSRRPYIMAGRQRYYTLATVMAWAAALMTISRHALLAICVFLVVTAAADLRKSKWVWVLSGGALLLVGSGYLGSFNEFWLARLSKGGISTDANLSARLQTRPWELFDRIMHEPSVFYWGTGLGSEHILHGPEYGFVSNGFLLYLFYCGILAFMAFAWCFVYAFQRALSQPRDQLPAVVPAGVLAMAVIVAADNYAFFTTSLVFMWAVGIGLSFMPSAKSGAVKASAGSSREGGAQATPPGRTPGGTGSPGRRPPIRFSPRTR